MLAVCWLMIALAAASLALSLVRGAHGTSLMVVGDVVMLAAMVDICLISSHLVSPIAWGGALLVLAVAAAAASRIRRGRAADAPALHDGGHPLAMIIGAGFLILLGAGGHQMASPASDAHAHAAGGGMLVGALALGAVAHAIVVVAGARTLGRVEVARRLSGSGSLLAMAAMAVAAGS
ncbi:hypothetical protein [Homoserinimonas hongtaonis]|uniref:DUF5134 domain-containing protein n=1 Tax=Homoserinimonas hongtaonis TaxID=2079791 RepID=A0A2U1SWL4_9MICO|nr:hypothetical protein [Salinibacterium hongtaonis]PWB96025.1 hypothetical protein DF220_11540 [Salinibacterium hongtaonis]